ncbi:MAG TPA: RNHCP domain-containing protein [Acidimicrobiia bacterium]|nr:RNHCP domain-containing protein [Acidimicrobiia bacterium]
MSERFQKRIEDFQCLNCGAQVQGNGFTDHCPKCLYGKHVDVNPGDRANECGGTLKPLNIAPNKSGYKIFYGCQKCGTSIANKASENDDISNFIDSQNNPDSLAERLPPI